MSSNPRTTAQKKTKLLKALEKTLGVVTTACSKADVPTRTFYEWLKKDDKFRAAVEAVEPVTIDFAESMNYKLMRGYVLPDSRVFMVETTRTYFDEELQRTVVERTKSPVVVPVDKHIGPNQAAVELFLTTKGKARGYDKTLKVSLKGSAKLKVMRVTQKPAGPGGTLSVTRPEKKKRND